eukprot:TRINITY_DN3465_c0_g2_i1.p1 TRINITY_DN3465_c0_g2~~TRINITY_DN3465_c0_g2_i1.p1  ORF type:complete len:674 (+),score=79.76 TRINITY_DN3465_c0_g2_i1:174-2195(+)
MAELTTDDEVRSVDSRVWTRRQRLTFPSVQSGSGSNYSLPLYLCNTDTDIVLTQAEGKRQQLAAYEDVLYEALDHRLFWLQGQPSGNMLLYCQSEEPITRKHIYDQPSELALTQPEAVLQLSDFFRDDIASIRARWELGTDIMHDPTKRISTMDLQSNAPACGPIGQALVLDTAAGFLALSRSLPIIVEDDSRLHVRVHFFDDGQNYSAMGHWLGIKSARGTAAIGIGFAIEGCYSVLNGEVPTGEKGKYVAWNRTSVDRHVGWHLFEIVLESGMVRFIIDSELVFNATAEGSCVSTEVCLVSRCGGSGIWAGVELFHLPRLAASETEDPRPGARRPWMVHTEKGRWQADESGVLQDVWFEPGAVALITSVQQQLIDSFSRVLPKYEYKAGMQEMLGRTYKVLSVNADGMVGLESYDGSDDGIWWFPPYATAIVVVDKMNIPPPPPPPPSAPLPTAVQDSVLPGADPEIPEHSGQAWFSEQEQLAQETGRLTSPTAGVGNLTITRWSRGMPTDEHLAQVDRAMDSLLDALRQADVVLPNNIRRLQRCRVEGHSNCLVYSFGTRRVHLATRGTEAGRLDIVVRCGGGYMDFIEFARRHGSLEQLRLQRQQGIGGREVVRMTSVLSSGRIKAVNNNSTPPRPPPISPTRSIPRSASRSIPTSPKRASQAPPVQAA